MLRAKITGSTLKWIALVSMLIDHFAAVFYTGSRLFGHPLFSPLVFNVLRGVGRLAFPIYCFLLVEGYLHTRNVKKYLLRLFCFGLLSELPFDLALYRTWIHTGKQNVYFTLFLGLLGIWLWDLLTKRDAKTCGMPRLLLGGGALFCAAIAARFLHTDYGLWGVLLIEIFYLYRQWEGLRDLLCCAVLLRFSTLEAASFVDFILFHFYSGERGKQLKYLFYVFYPAHFLLLALLRYLFYGI